VSAKVVEEAGSPHSLTLEELSAFVARAYGAGGRDDTPVYVGIPVVSMNNEKCRVRKVFVEVES
jgi:hypothetical protein